MQLQNTESFVRHLGLQIAPTEFVPFTISANILPIPAVIMLIIAGRGFIFWCFNILFIPIVMAYARNILYGGKRTPDSGDEHDFQYARNHAHGNNNILEVIATYFKWKMMSISNDIPMLISILFDVFRIISQRRNGVDTAIQAIIINISMIIWLINRINTI